MTLTPSIDRPAGIVRGRAAWGEANANARLTAPAVLDAIRSHRAGEKPHSIARRIGCCRETVRNIVTGKNWQHLTGLGPASTPTVQSTTNV